MPAQGFSWGNSSFVHDVQVEMDVGNGLKNIHSYELQSRAYFQPKSIYVFSTLGL